MERIQALSFPPKLEALFLYACSRVVNIPALPALRTLSVQYCHGFGGEAVTFLPNLHVIRVQNCKLVQGVSRIVQEHLERGRLLTKAIDRKNKPHS
jgi:hypothetical protein